MTKTIFSILLSLGFVVCSFGQHNIRGKVIDGKSEPLSYATVALLNPADSTLKFFGVTNDKGEYQIKKIKAGQYLMQFSFVGMETIYDRVSIPADSGEDFGEKILTGTTLDEVIVEAELIPLRFKKDTLEFDAKAFKTRPGASVEELLEKLPGVEVDESGNVKAQGEDVVKVLVDGKEFFDKDPKVATKNLPAKALDKIQVYDRKTEEASFTGIDDGVRDRTINLKLKEDHKKGAFGELSIGAGTNETYNLRGNIYRFSKKYQATLLGSYNNNNQFGFSHKGNNQFGTGTKGINKTLSGGFNLSHNKGQKNRYYLSYIGSNRKNELEQTTSTENFLAKESFLQLEQLSETETDRPHNINYGVRHNVDKQNRIIIDGDLQLSNNDLQSNAFTESSDNIKRINTQDNNTNEGSNQLRFNSKAVYISKFNEDRTQIKTKISGSYQDEDNRLDWTNLTRFFDPTDQSLVDQFRNNETNRLELEASPTLVQKINNTWSVDISADLGNTKRNLLRKEGLRNATGEFTNFSIPDFSTNEVYVQPSLSFNRNTKKSQLNLSMEAIANRFDKILNNNSIGRPKYFYWLPRFSYRNEYRSGRRLEIRYNTRANMPSTGQLYPVVDSINQLLVFQGNPNLRPSYRHSLTADWRLFDQFSFTSLFIRLNGRYIKDNISTSQTIDENFIQLRMPVNVPDDYQASSFVDFTTPIRAVGMNINIRWRESWNRRMVLVNNRENINNRITHRLNLSFENRKKEKWSVRFGGSISLTNSEFSLAKSRDNVFFNTGYFTNLRFTPNQHWNFEARANVTNYNSQSFDESVNIPLISANVSYSFLQAEKASLVLSGFDLLNKLVGIQRISDANYLMQREWNTIGQYVMLSFRLRMR